MKASRLPYILMPMYTMRSTYNFRFATSHLTSMLFYGQQILKKNKQNTRFMEYGVVTFWTLSYIGNVFV